MTTPDWLPRFLSKIDMSGPIPTRRPDLGRCWQWTAVTLPAGYGQFWLDGRKRYAHRVSYALHIGTIPAGLHIDHLCRNTSCVNPRHLEAVTHTENNRRSDNFAGKRARQTHCVNGHPFTPENTYRVPSNGTRKCRTCNTKAKAAQRARHRQKAAA